MQAPQPGTDRPSPPTPLRVRKRVWTDVAKIISTVLNPFVTSLTLFVVLADVRSNGSHDFWILLFNSAFFTSIAPMLFIFYLYATDRISDLDMSVREERERVFIAFVLLYALGALDLWLIHAPVIMTASMAGYAASLLIGDRPDPFYVLIPLLWWSRVYLRAHTVLQVVAGTVLALANTLLFFRIFHVV